jgi:hypothetical protein
MATLAAIAVDTYRHAKKCDGSAVCIATELKDSVLDIQIGPDAALATRMLEHVRIALGLREKKGRSA